MTRLSPRAVLTGTVLLLVACAGRGTAPGLSPAPADAYAPCWAPDSAVAEGGQHSERCWRAVEADLLARSDGGATRTEEGIVVRTGQGVEVMEDDTASADEFVRYRYGGYLPAVHQHLVHADYYEGGAVVAVDARTGNQADLLALPAVSPDSLRLAAANVDLVAAYTSSGLQVWRVTPTGLELEWALDGGGRWGASAPHWLSPDRVTFVFHTLDESTMELRGRPAVLDLRRDGINLRLEP
jgi:hypothetical protein